MAMHDAVKAYQEDKKFEEYLIVRQQILQSASHIKDVLLGKLVKLFQEEKELTEVLNMVA